MRKKEIINCDWRFSLGATLDKSKEEIVCLPHSVTLTPAISSGCRNYQGTCVYQKNLYIDKSQADKKLFIEFEGAMGITVLKINGKEIKTHYCGYIPLVADITDHIKYDFDNVIELHLDNSDNEDVPPGKAQHSLDFTYDGGLYRDASLTATDRLYITNCLLEDKPAGGGVFVWSSDIKDGSANINVRTHIRNEHTKNKSFELLIKILDDKDKVIAEKRAPLELSRDEDISVDQSLTISDPMLWSPETPYLYKAVVSLVEGLNEADSVTVETGIRTFEYTHDKNIIWNGKSRIISGANYHQTFPYLGNAVPNSLLCRDIELLRNTGMKNLRSHYPLATALTDACNRLGMTVIVSAPGWQWFKEGEFVEHAYKNVRQMVRFTRNNPCVILWEPMLNETVMPEDFQQKLHDIVHEEYPFEPCFTASDHGPTDISYRQYDPGMLEPGMQGYDPCVRYGATKEYPVWIREYSDAPDDWHNQSCAWRTPRGWGDTAMIKAVDRMLGLDSQCQTNNYIDMVNDSTLCGYGIWPGIEHNRGYHINPCWGGFFDLFRVPKFTHYFMKSQLDFEEAGAVLFIANWWTEISPDDVTVYSNADSVRLYHDGVLVEEQKPQDIAVPHPPFIFKNVRTRFHKRERSLIKAEAIINGKVVAAATQKSPGVPKSLRLRADEKTPLLLAGGSDAAIIYCDILDAEGNLVPLMGDRHPIIFEISGEAQIVGDSSIGANPICAEAGTAAIIVRSTKKAGKIKIKASMLWTQNNDRAAITPDELDIISE